MIIVQAKRTLPTETILLAVTVGTDTTFDPNLVGFGANDINWDFGGGAANIDDGSGDLSSGVAITSAPVSIQASTSAVVGPWTLNAANDEISSISYIDPNITSLILSNNNVGSIPTTSLVNMQDLQVGNAGLTSLDTTSMLGLTALRANQNSIDSIDLVNNPNLSICSLQINTLSSIDVQSLIALVSLRLENNDLIATSIDQMLIDLDANYADGTGRTLRYDNQSTGGHLNSNRSASATTARASLVTKNWNIPGTY